MKRFLAPALAGFAGLVCLVFLFPRFDPSREIGAVQDRTQAIAKSRRLASKYGVNPAGWQAAVTEVVDSPAGPVKLEVALIAPDRKRYLQVAWNSDGTMASWRPHGLPSSAAPPVPAKSAASKKSTRRVPYSWSNSSGNVTFREDDDDPAAAASYRWMRVIAAFWYLAAMVYFPVAAFRRRLHYRVPLLLMGAQLVWAALSYWGTSAYQRLLIERLSESRGALALAISSLRPAEGWSFLWLFVFAAVGFSIRAMGNREKWSTLEVIGQGRLYNRAVGWPVAAGLMSGVGIAAIPYVLAATGLFHRPELVLRSVDALAAPLPNASAWMLSAAALPLGLFGFAYPLVAKVRNRWLRWLLFVPVGISIMGGAGRSWTAPFSSSAPNLAVAVLLFAAFTALYLRIDLLATMTAMVAARAVLTPCVLLSQSGGSVRALAVPVLLVGATLVAVSLHAAIRGREGVDDIPDAEPALDPAEVNTETGRVRLAAEFEVARKAQQDALPSTAPAVEGFSVSGSCEPAQQVGGDLYDYFRLPDGRLSIAVADVSGKGVPAALYMMVTKGLLAAATRDSSDLAYILEQTNLHLYRACKKKVFVTLAAVALDPLTRRLQHGRAGHNPILWRRTGRGETVMLKPPGLGLGMTQGDRFNRSLKIEELQLEPGDAIVLYSDGVTEAVDATMEQFGEGRLIRSLEKTDGQPADASRAAILRDLADFVGTTPARDDVTVVVLRVSEFAVA